MEKVFTQTITGNDNRKLIENEATFESIINSIVKTLNEIKGHPSGKIYTEFILELANAYKEEKEHNIQKEEQISFLVERLKRDDLELLTKNDIKELLKCENEKALSFLRLMYVNKLGIKIGKEYYMTKKDWNSFVSSYKGKNLIL